jgi:hypothetical protein
MASGPLDLVERLAAATTAHDLEGIVRCFAPTYVNETPAHPGRGFVGAEQVRRNWTMILDGVPDITARVLASSVDGTTVWSEWELSGTRRDGAAHLIRGVIIVEVRDDLAQAARFYLEPVEADSGPVDAAVARAVGDATTAAPVQ